MRIRSSSGLIVVATSNTFLSRPDCPGLKVSVSVWLGVVAGAAQPLAPDSAECQCQSYTAFSTQSSRVPETLGPEQRERELSKLRQIKEAHSMRPPLRGRAVSRNRDSGDLPAGAVVAFVGHDAMKLGHVVVEDQRQEVLIALPHG